MNSGSPGHALPVAIAGGGIGGLAAALALARRGFPVVVLEKADAFGEAGVGLQVAPNALNVLQGLGVGAAAQRDALLIERPLGHRGDAERNPADGVDLAGRGDHDFRQEAVARPGAGLLGFLRHGRRGQEGSSERGRDEKTATGD